MVNTYELCTVEDIAEISLSRNSKVLEGNFISTRCTIMYLFHPIVDLSMWLNLVTYNDNLGDQIVGER